MVTPFGSESACSFCFGVVCVLDIQRPSQILFVVFFLKENAVASDQCGRFNDICFAQIVSIVQKRGK